MTMPGLELSVIAPFRNARGAARANVERLADRLSALRLAHEILAVDDASRDGTVEELGQAARARAQIRVLRASRHLGKGACLGEAMRASRGAVVLFTDGDLAYPPEAIPALLRALASADVAIARRAASLRAAARTPRRLRRWLSPRFTSLAQWIVPGVSDPQAGFKGFRRDAAQLIASRQRCRGFCFDVEALAVARAFGLKVAEVPVAWDPSGPSTVRPLRDGARMLAELAAIGWRLRRGVYARPQSRWWQGEVCELGHSNLPGSLRNVSAS